MTDPLDVTNPQPAKHLATTRMADTHGAGQLVVLSGETAGRRVVVEDGILLGRDPEAGLSFEGVSTVSRQHARITRQPSGLWLLEDLGSSNGTSINGSPVERAVLRFGDKIRLGSSTVLLFGRHDPLEDQLFEAQRFQLLGQLAAGIAHDFNNVLGAILTNADHLAAPGDIGAAEAEQCVNDIRAATRQGADLVRQLLSFATPGQKEARAARVSTVTEEVRRLLSRTIQRTVTFESQVPADLTAACTPSVLLQILMNLCVNAVQAMPKGGTIRITSAAVDPSEAGLDLPSADPYTRISVEDNGLGMDAKTKKMAFEPFFTTKPRGKGTGLGLATVAKIVAEHHGRVQLTSDLGKGTRFDLYLPASRIPVVEPHRGQTLHEQKAITASVLVVDDDPFIASALQRALVHQGMAVITASNGLEGIEAYRERKGPIDLVLLDLDMPGMGGAEALSELLKIDPQARVLISSGAAEGPEIDRLRAAGASGFLQKPFETQTLLSTIADLLPPSA